VKIVSFIFNVVDMSIVNFFFSLLTLTKKQRTILSPNITRSISLFCDSNHHRQQQRKNKERKMQHTQTKKEDSFFKVSFKKQNKRTHTNDKRKV